VNFPHAGGKLGRESFLRYSGRSECRTSTRLVRSDSLFQDKSTCLTRASVRSKAAELSLSKVFDARWCVCVREVTRCVREARSFSGRASARESAVRAVRASARVLSGARLPAGSCACVSESRAGGACECVIPVRGACAYASGAIKIPRTDRCRF